MKKRFLAIFLALALCVGLCAVPAFAAEEKFFIEDGVLTGYNGPGGDVVIPDGVTSIGVMAFSDCESLTSVTIPNSVTSIGDQAFYRCSSLASVTIPESVTFIGGSAFEGTPWLEGQGEFPVVNGILLAYQGNGSSVTIPNGVTKIGGSAFADCYRLTSVVIPNSVTSIGDFAFFYCTGLTSVTIPDGVVSIGNSAFSSCTGLTSVTIPNSVTSIGICALSGCTSLTSVTIPNSVTSIGGWAFEYCTGLTDVYYGGTEAQWEAITIDYSENGNYYLENAAIHYNSVIAKFPDLKPNGFYVDAVEWAVTNGVTNGKTATTFAPDLKCSHSEILTFLWRAAGEPESSAQPPISMKGNEFYYKAVKWAAEKGMIGADFNPNAPCNRAYAVLYIWQAKGKPAASSASPFTDVPAHWSSAPAVAWAVEKGVTTGKTATTFNPGGICSRGEIVTFLYRAYK